MTAVDQLREIETAVRAAAAAVRRPPEAVHLIAVSKTFPMEAIRPLLVAGHRRFGENRIQEAQSKFTVLREDFPDLELHLIGPIQSNKARDAVRIADVIHTLDRDRIARAIADEIQKQGRAPKLLVEINTGGEAQKAGIAPGDAPGFVTRCRVEFGLAIEGLMCIPPAGADPAPHFALVDELARRTGLAWRSMGMSSDYEIAVHQGATHVRVGSAIFGHRDRPA